jgi:hypothetical protein
MTMFDWINPLVAYFGIGAVSIAGLLAIAWFFPPFRNLALMVAAGVAAALTAYTKGSRDGSKHKQGQWDRAEKNMVDKANKARADAERDADAGRLHDDEFDRDKSKVRRPGTH